jgi:hypothetical protein
VNAEIRERFAILSKAAVVLAIFLMLSPADVPASETVGSGNCTVRLLHPGDESELPARYEGKIVNPVSKHRLVVKEALALMPPLTCAAVQRLAFVRTIRGHAGEEGWVSNDTPDLVNINVDVIDPLRRAGDDFGAYWTVKPMQAVLHESTHAADFLLHAHGAKTGVLGTLAGTEYYKDSITTPNPNLEQWSANAQRLAKQSVEANRLGGSLRAEWGRIQNAFQAFGLGGAYRGPRQADETDDYAQLVKDGFTSRYGATSVGEDIAEFAGWMLAAPLMEREWDGKAMPPKAIDDHACKSMSAYGKEAVPSNLALLFTKANLLLSAGFVTQGAYDRCVGRLKLLNHDQGIYVWDHVGDPSVGDWEFKRSFTTDTRASIGAYEKLDQYVFDMSAWGNAEFGGKTYPTVIELRVAIAPLDKDIKTVSWPRGIYDLHALGNRFSVSVPDAPAGTFFSTQGLLLIGYATGKRIDGSLILQQAIRPHAPLPVPQTGLPQKFTIALRK